MPDYKPRGGGVITVNVGGLSTSGSAGTAGDLVPEIVPAGDITK
jgi:hypothetical protein